MHYPHSPPCYITELLYAIESKSTVPYWMKGGWHTIKALLLPQQLTLVTYTYLLTDSAVEVPVSVVQHEWPPSQQHSQSQSQSQSQPEKPNRLLPRNALHVYWPSLDARASTMPQPSSVHCCPDGRAGSRPIVASAAGFPICRPQMVGGGWWGRREREGGRNRE